MANHEATDDANLTLFPSGFPENQARGIAPIRLPDTVVAQMIRDSFNRTMAEAKTCPAPIDLSRTLEDLQVLQEKHVPKLEKPLRGYKRLERLKILLSHDQAGFIPTGLDELRDAFGLAHYLDRGRDGEQKIDHIGENRIKDASPEDTVEQTIHEVRKVTSRVSQNYAARARHAETDQWRLEQARRAVAASKASGERYDSLAEFFGASHTPVFEGRGQLARFIEGVLLLTENPQAIERYALTAKTGPNRLKQSVVADPSTNPALISKELEHRQTVILSSVGIEDAPLWFGLAIDNERKTKLFWEKRSQEAMRSEVAMTAASAAVSHLTA